jgi:hypothetical protein
MEILLDRQQAMVNELDA